jgi:hypothetical protein
MLERGDAPRFFVAQQHDLSAFLRSRFSWTAA